MFMIFLIQTFWNCGNRNGVCLNAIFISSFFIYYFFFSRPLPEDFMEYARQDSHYLLYVYDLMRNELIERGNQLNNLITAVYSRSVDICLKVSHLQFRSVLFLFYFFYVCSFLFFLSYHPCVIVKSMWIIDINLFIYMLIYLLTFIINDTALWEAIHWTRKSHGIIPSKPQNLWHKADVCTEGTVPLERQCCSRTRWKSRVSGVLLCFDFICVL